MRIRERSGREAERYVGEKLKEREADAIFLPRYQKKSVCEVTIFCRRGS